MASGAARRGMSTPDETDPVSPGEFDGEFDGSSHKAGLERLGAITFDGTNIAATASRSASCRQQWVQQVDAITDAILIAGGGGPPRRPGLNQTPSPTLDSAIPVRKIM
jgi:hypothetical protein